MGGEKVLFCQLGGISSLQIVTKFLHNPKMYDRKYQNQNLSHTWVFNPQFQPSDLFKMSRSSSESNFDEILNNTERFYAKPASSDETYSAVKQGANILVVPINHLREYRTVIDTIEFKPIVLTEFNDNSVETELKYADGAIFENESQLNNSPFNGIKILKSCHPSKEYITAEITSSNITFTKNSENYVFSLAEHIKSLPFEKIPPVVKICGLKTVEAAAEAINAGANMLGMIMVPGRSRSVSPEAAIEISKLVKAARAKKPSSELIKPNREMSVFDSNSLRIRSPNQGPFIVGVFRNQSLEDVLKMQEQFELDYVQLHGDEPIEWAKQIPVPVIKRFTPGTPEFDQCLSTGAHAISLIDSPLGGEGKMVDRTILDGFAKKGARFIIAGGLNPENVSSVNTTQGVIGVDVSGGVETNGEKDFSKIRAFVKNANHGW